jgi:hypothetical protein
LEIIDLFGPSTNNVTMDEKSIDKFFKTISDKNKKKNYDKNKYPILHDRMEQIPPQFDPLSPSAPTLPDDQITPPRQKIPSLSMLDSHRPESKFVDPSNLPPSGILKGEAKNVRDAYLHSLGFHVSDTHENNAATAKFFDDMFNHLWTEVQVNKNPAYRDKEFNFKFDRTAYDTWEENKYGAQNNKFIDRARMLMSGFIADRTIKKKRFDDYFTYP